MFLCAEGARVKKTLPYGGVFRAEDSSVQKSLPYGRIFRTEMEAVRKTLPYESAVMVPDLGF